MKNILARGGVEFLAVFLGIALSLWVDEYQKSKEEKELNNQILGRLYDNLESDSTDGIWNYKAHDKVVMGGQKVLQWCENGQKNLDSIDFFISSLVVTTTFINNSEEYASLKSSGRMELINDVELVKALHDYYTQVSFVKHLENVALQQVYNQFHPFMSDYSSFYDIDKNKNVYANEYGIFILSSKPPKDKLSYYATKLKWESEYIAFKYRELVDDVAEIRKLIRKELKNN